MHVKDVGYINQWLCNIVDCSPSVFRDFNSCTMELNDKIAKLGINIRQENTGVTFQDDIGLLNCYTNFQNRHNIHYSSTYPNLCIGLELTNRFP